MIIGISRRWAIFFITCLLFVLSQFYRASVAVISPNLIADLDLHTSGLSLLSAVFFYAFALMQIPVGLYLDSIGPRIAMTVLSLVAVAGSLIFALGESLAALVTGRTLLGIGMACNLMGTLKQVTVWFGPLRFATLSALVISVGTAGNIAAATPLVLMVQAMGWRMTFVVFAGINLFLALLCFTVVRDRPDATAAGPAVARVSAKPRDIIAGVKALFAEKDYWIISLGTFCRYGIFAAVQALWAGPYLMELIGVSPVAAGNLLFLMSTGMIVGSPLCGWFSDSWIRSRKPVVVGGLSGMLIVLVILAGLESGTGYLTLAVLFFGFGFFSSAGQIMYAHIKERMPIERAGTAMTGINFFTMTGVAVFLQGLGNMMERLYPGESLGPAAFRTSFLFCAGCLALASLLYLMTRETLGRGAYRR
ncbi:MAG: MFS transporter [Desulfobacteraceae bacterium]